jgi:hypothetical protein
MNDLRDRSPQQAGQDARELRPLGYGQELFRTMGGFSNFAISFSISVIGLYLSYIIPVYLGWRARGTAAETPRGPWHLGQYGWAINLVAVLWVVFITVILSIPDNLRAGKTMAALTLLLGAWYWVRERHRFRGPAWAAPHSDSATPVPAPSDA